MRRRLAAGALALTAATSTIVTGSATADPATPLAPAVLAVGQHAHPSGVWQQAHARWAAWLRLTTAQKAKMRHDAAVAAAAEWKAQLKAHAKARAAAARRASRAAARKALLTPSYVWAHQPFSIRVANCESGGGPGDHSSVYDGNPYLNDPNGHHGKWQFDYSTWREVGGSGNPANYSVTEQDARAYALWRANGWSRWQCAGMVG